MSRTLVVLGIVIALSGCLNGAQRDANEKATTETVLPEYGPPVPPGAYKFQGSYSHVLLPGALKELPLQKTFLKSELDAVDIEIGVWLPDVPEGTKVPVIVDAGPYYGNNGPPMEKPSRHLQMLKSNFVPHGYAVAGVSVRGTGGSGGCMDLMGEKEVADLDHAITWLGEQPWSNGNVAMIGKSYDGSTPWMVASTGNPHLKTIVPVSGVPDLYELMFRNGTSEIRGSFLLNAIYYSFVVREQAEPPMTPEDIERAARHTAEGAACPDHAVGLGASLYAGTYGERDPTGYWAERNLKPRVEQNYKGSVLLVQGLQDWNVDPALSIPWADQLNRSGLYVHHFLGQWGHDHPDQNTSPSGDPNMRWDWAEILLRWFDYWLKGDTSIDLGPPVQALDQTGRWHWDESFPPRDAEWRMFHLASGEELAPEPGIAGDVVLLLNPVGRNAPALEAVPGYSADFLTPPQDEDLLISGLPRVHVTVTPQGPTGYLAAWLYDVDEVGQETRIGMTTMNLLFADGSETATPLTPNEPILAKMEIQPMDAVVAKDHRLLLRVWQYRDDPAGDEVQGRLPLLPSFPVTLNYGGNFHSVVELPVIERGPEYYFEPPQPA